MVMLDTKRLYRILAWEVIRLDDRINNQYHFSKKSCDDSLISPSINDLMWLVPVGPLEVEFPECGRIILLEATFFIGFVKHFEFLSIL
jgi:hypothetical protein